MSQSVGPTQSYIVATDNVGSDDYQVVKLADGSAGSTTRVVYDSNQGFLVNTGKSTRIKVVPAITTTIYAAGDAVGGLLTFAGAARYSGGGGLIQSVSLFDLNQARAAMQLILFNQSFTATSDNSPFNPSDADLANYIAAINIASSSSDYFNFVNNSVTYKEVNIPFAAVGGTSIYGQLVTQGTPTYSFATDINVMLNIFQE